ncbi:MAG: TonB-dependent receptor [Gammaproteobacteria bacterium]|nr:TonB-dependent receptor [Gammaproteobacteria bacterium]
MKKISGHSPAVAARPANTVKLLALAVAAFALPTPALHAAVLEEVIVTAQKREQSNQDVPISITALGADAIERRGIQNTEDLIGQIPGVGGFTAPGSRGNTGLAIRGVSGGSPANLSLDPAVATYLDGVFIGKLAGGSVDVAELERVEVLRGPQGTLYGRNATGGAVNYITRKPSGEFGLRAVGTVGDYDLYGLKLNVDTPTLGNASDGLGAFAASLGVQTRERDGFYDNDSGGEDFNNLDRQAWRFAVNWNFRDSLFVDYAYDGSQLDETNNLDAVVGFNPLDAAGNVDRVTALQGTLAQAQAFAATPGTDPRIASRWIPSLERTIDVYEQRIAQGEGRRNGGGADITPASEVESDGHSLTLAWETSGLTFKSITAYRDVEVSALGDIDDIDSRIDANGVGAFNDTAHLTLGQIYGATSGFDPGIPQVPLDAFWGAINELGGALHFSQNSESEYEQFSQEFQVLGNTDTIEWVAGLYYFDDQAKYARTSLALVPLAPVGEQAYQLETEAWAVFGQATWTPGWLDDRIAITGGLRYTEEDKDIEWNNAAQIGVLTPPVPPASAVNDDSFDNVSGNLTVAFQATDDINTYVRYATGYRSGGFNGELFNSPSFEEETIETWEIGMKSDWLDGRMRINAALYAYEWDDLQVSQIETVEGTPTTRIVNAGSAERWGGEIEVQVVPVEDMVVGLSYSYLDGDFEEFPDLCGDNAPADCIPGEDFANRGASPDNQFNLYADYLFARTDFGEITGWVNVNWQDEWFTTAASTAVIDGTPVIYEPQVMDERTVIDARLSLENIEVGDGNLRFTLWGKNLTDEDYSTYGINFGANLGLLTENYGDPRTWGLEVAYEY